MRFKHLIEHIDHQLAALEQKQEHLEANRTALWAKLNPDNESEIKAKLEETKLAIWECQGMQKAYDDLLQYLTNPPIFQVVAPETGAPQTSEASCPKCSGTLAVTTTIEAAPQPGYVTISSHYECQTCGHYDQEQVCLPKEIALQEYNLEQLMKGV
jgi:hypothetical protein